MLRGTHRQGLAGVGGFFKPSDRATALQGRPLVGVGIDGKRAEYIQMGKATRRGVLRRVKDQAILVTEGLAEVAVAAHPGKRHASLFQLAVARFPGQKSDTAAGCTQRDAATQIAGLVRPTAVVGGAVVPRVQLMQRRLAACVEHTRRISGQ
ncbi:hypothetical protein D3C80_1618690 [compost metagenome]